MANLKKSAGAQKGAASKKAAGKTATKNTTAAKPRKPKANAVPPEEPVFVEPIIEAPVIEPSKEVEPVMPVKTHERIIGTLKEDFQKEKEIVEAELDKWRADAIRLENEAKAYTQPIRDDEKKLSEQKRWIIWAVLIAVALVILWVFVIDPYLVNRSDEKETKYEQQVKVLNHQKDSLQQDLLFYKRMAMEQQAKTDDYKAKAAAINAVSAENDAQREQERNTDKKKVENEKAAIRNAHTDADILGTLTSTLRQ